jgi:hypothetical protein
MNVMFSRQINTAEFQQFLAAFMIPVFHVALVKDISQVQSALLTACKRPLAPGGQRALPYCCHTA